MTISGQPCSAASSACADAGERFHTYTETDDNDLTYFVVAQADVIIRALQELSTYIDRTMAGVREAESKIRSLDL